MLAVVNYDLVNLKKKRTPGYTGDKATSKGKGMGDEKREETGWVMKEISWQWEPLIG